VGLINAPNPIEAASTAFDQGKLSKEDVKRIMLLFMNDMGWDMVEPFLDRSERAMSEFTMNSDDEHDLQDEFTEFVQGELEVNSA
jgi:hypothetical protein